MGLNANDLSQNKLRGEMMFSFDNNTTEGNTWCVIKPLNNANIRNIYLDYFWQIITDTVKLIDYKNGLYYFTSLKKDERLGDYRYYILKYNEFKIIRLNPSIFGKNYKLLKSEDFNEILNERTKEEIDEKFFQKQNEIDENNLKRNVRQK